MRYFVCNGIMGSFSSSCRNLCSPDEVHQGDTASRNLVFGEAYEGPLPSGVSTQKNVCEVYRQLGLDDSWLSQIKPLRIPKKGALYYGQVNRGQPFGHARVILDDGSFFEGDFNRMEASCKDGIFIYKDGSYYRGGISRNRANGHGHISYKTDLSLTYDGDWLDDLPHGHGKEVTKAGWQYVGYFHHGVKQGNGRLQWPNGDYYTGNFHEGYIDGEGELVSEADGYRYKGGWKKNKREGRGEEIYSTGLIYEGIKVINAGIFKNDLRDGKGAWLDADGTKTPIEYQQGVEM